MSTSAPIALITGVEGQDGWYLSQLLKAEGFEVHGTVHREPNIGDETVEQLIANRVGIHVADVVDGDRMRMLFDAVRPDHVFHLAGVSSVARSWEDPVGTTRTNSMGTAVAVAEALRFQNASGKPVTFVNASSAEVFAGSGRVPIDETAPIAPITPYGASKALGHTLCVAYRAKGLAASNVILFNHESPKRPNTFVTGRIAETVARIAAGSPETLSLGNLSAQRDWGWAPDYVDAMRRIALTGRGEDYVVATGTLHSVADFVAAAFASVGIEDWAQRVEVADHLERPNDAAVLVGDSTRLRTELDWAPTRTFEEIVESMVNHYAQKEMA
ncbi:GDP-mannose 4,6-dehydratase [Gordonia sputi]|uniref:GDP-mannose 4,6-dehydratase n=1 Tax=Gordonia sputi TaxID=36823 RepID=UPI00226DDF46|nr:GDP-mannose 4,6-dehydratase [Gordonia sputi]